MIRAKIAAKREALLKIMEDRLAAEIEALEMESPSQSSTSSADLITGRTHDEDGRESDSGHAHPSGHQQQFHAEQSQSSVAILAQQAAQEHKSKAEPASGQPPGGLVPGRRNTIRLRPVEPRYHQQP